MMRKVLLLLAMLCLHVSCEKEGAELKVWTVASEQVYRKAILIHDPVLCYVYKERREVQWKVTDVPIEGFDYEPGYEYEIVVRITAIKIPDGAVLDGPAEEYALISMVSKIRKDSENLPPKYLDYPEVPQ